MLMEEHIKCFIEDKQISSNRGFLRALPLISSLYEPIYTYHASKWYHKYMHKYGSFDNLFKHTWVHLDEIKKCTDLSTFSIILDRDSIDHLETKTPRLLDDILSSILATGVENIVLAIDDTHEFRISNRRTRPISSLVRVSKFDVMFNNWVRDVECLHPTINCRSKSFILKSYGIYEQTRSNITSILRKKAIYETLDEILQVDMPLLVIDILHSIMEKINEPNPSTHIKVYDVERYLTPWFENRRELVALRNRCCECIDDIENFPFNDQSSLKMKIEADLIASCSSENEVNAYNMVKRMVDGCVI